jgi:GT2 family glycosyltransferase
METELLENEFVNNIDVSIVIVNYNTRDLLEKCLESIYSSVTGIQIDVVVVDNNSEDNSLQMCIRKFPEVKLIQNSENKRYAIANNQGWQAMTGSNILFLNSDTIVLEGAIEAMVKLLELNSMIGGCSCKLLNGDGSLQRNLTEDPTIWNQLYCHTFLSSIKLIRKPWSSYHMKGFDFNCECKVSNVFGSVLMVKRGLLEKIDGMDEGFPFYFEDTDLCRRLCELGSELWYTPKGQIIHFGGGSSEANTKKPELSFHFYYGLLRYLRKYHNKNTVFCFCLLWKPMVLITYFCSFLWNCLRFSIYYVIGKREHRSVKKYLFKLRASSLFLVRYFVDFLSA